MSTRRQHAKSRKGCITCKARHVRCDETGPPCRRCKIRGDACEYACGQSRTDGADTSTTINQGSTASISPRYREIVFPANRHLLELQLMHRWSISTYKCCCTPGSEDDEVWQSWVPQFAVKHDYLLYGLLSLTAFATAKLAETPHRRQYIESATEYHGLALSSFRAYISSPIDPDNTDAAVCMSLMLLVLAFASAQASAATSSGDESDSVVQIVLDNVELLRGCAPIIESKQGYLLQNPYIQKLKPFEDLPRTQLDPQMKEALVTLDRLNDERITTSVRDTVSQTQRAQQIECWEVCKAALGILQTLYEKCVDEFTRGYALGWLNMAGDRYIEAVKDSDLVALLMLMYWGVLVEKCGQQVWWAEQFGSSLVAEIAHRPMFEGTDAVVEDLILRARRQCAT